MTRASIAKTVSNPLADDRRIHHVRCRDFGSGPIGTTIRGYCGFAGRELTPQTEGGMRNYLATNKRDRHGKFRSSTKLLADIGEDLEPLHEEFRPARERFGVEIEQRD
jgi:hypothetical protein